MQEMSYMRIIMLEKQKMKCEVIQKLVIISRLSSTKEGSVEPEGVEEGLVLLAL